MKLDLQKASLWKRTAAGLFDGILTGVLAVGAAFLLSLLLNYDGYSQTLNNAYAQYEKEFGVSFAVTQEDYDAMSPEERERYDEAYKKLAADEEAIYAYNMMVNLMMVITTLGILVAVAVLELAVPLWLGNGQTLGKKIFGLCLMRTDSVRIAPVQLFIRTVLGKFAVETMIPVYVLLLLFWGNVGLLGTVILLVLLAAQIVILLVTRNNSLIHDLLAGTAVVDYASQTIFRTTEDLIAYQKKLAAERAARQAY